MWSASIKPASPYFQSFNGFLIVNLYERKLNELLAEVSGQSKDDIFIANREGMVLTGCNPNRTGTGITLPIINKIGKSRSGYFTYTDDSHRQFVYYYAVASNNWIYLFRNPSHQLLNIPKNIGMLTLLLCLFLITANIIVSFLLSKKVYIPINNLLVTVRKVGNYKYQESINEFDSIDKAIKVLYEEKNRLNDFVDHNKQIIKTNILWKLLTGDMENPEEFQQMLLPDTAEGILFVELLKTLTMITDELHTFRAYVRTMLDFYFERLKRRNPEYYAVAVYDFFSNREVQREISSLLPPAPVYQFQQARAAMIEYTTMPDPEEPKKYIVAERMVFDSIAAFLPVDFFRGLMNGNVPRRCHNCGRYFLLLGGYDICYCLNIAPGETKRTCRDVGAHKKEARKEGKTPARLEYDKVYNRLKTRKARGKLTTDEWNDAVALALQYKDKAETGEISDFELKEIYDKM